jgi:hypothetical protein
MTEKSWADIHWQPIESLSLIRSMADGLLDETEKQYANLESCRSKPHVLDDYAVDRVIKVYTDQAGDLRLYEEQLCRWKKLDSIVSSGGRWSGSPHRFPRSGSASRQSSPWRRS